MYEVNFLINSTTSAAIVNSHNNNLSCPVFRLLSEQYRCLLMIIHVTWVGSRRKKKNLAENQKQMGRKITKKFGVTEEKIKIRNCNM